MSWSRVTSDGRYDWYATSKKTVQIPYPNPTAYSCQIVSDVGHVRDGDGREQREASEVACDEDRAPRQPVDPHARGDREEDEREELERREDRDLERGRLEREDGDERESELRRPASRTG